MAKKIKFPLEMENGVQVRSIEELKANFSLSRVLFYIYNGKMITWLKDRNAQSMADEIETFYIKNLEFIGENFEFIGENFEVFENNIEEDSQVFENNILKDSEAIEKLKEICSIFGVALSYTELSVEDIEKSINIYRYFFNKLEPEEALHLHGYFFNKLEMENGVQVRSIEELKANFSLTRVLFYIFNGKLVTWLEDKNAQSIANEVKALPIGKCEFTEENLEDFENLFYVLNGKLITWLKDKNTQSIDNEINSKFNEEELKAFENNIEEDVKAIEKLKKICSIFDINYNELSSEELEKSIHLYRYYRQKIVSDVISATVDAISACFKNFQNKIEEEHYGK